MKLIITVLCVAVFAQALGNPPVLGKDEDEHQSLEKKVNHINQALDKAHSTLDGALKNIKEKASEVTENAKSKLDQLLTPLKKELDVLKSKAPPGFHLAKCHEHVDKFTNSPKDLALNLGKCVTSPVTKARDYVNDAYKKIQKIKQNTGQLPDQLADCSSGNIFQKAKCYAQLSGKVASLAFDVQQVTADAAKISALVSGFIPALQSCAALQVAKIGGVAAQGVVGFGGCVAKN